MITSVKRRRTDEPCDDARHASTVNLLLALGVAALATFARLAQPPAPQSVNWIGAGYEGAEDTSKVEHE